MEYSKINYINPSELKPYERNTKRHPDSQLTKLVKLIENYGFPESKAVLVDEQLTIICGHGRTLASIKAGLKQIPYQILTGASDADIKAMRIADNAVSESPWDYEILKLEYQDLELEDFDINILSLADEHIEEIEKIVDYDDDDKTMDFEEAFDKVQDGDKTPFSQMTFTVHDSQKDIVDEALNKAKSDPSFDDVDNANSNGNALFVIAQYYLNYVS